MKQLITFGLVVLGLGCTGTIVSGSGEQAPAGDTTKTPRPPGSAAAASGDRAIPPSVSLPNGKVDSCTDVRPGASPLRRLTRFEYDRTVADLLQDTTSPAAGFPSEEAPYGFDNAAESFGTSPVTAEGYFTAAEDAAARAMKNPNLGACDLAKSTEAACARAFVEQLGKRTFRRPLTGAEVTRYTAAFATFRVTSDYRGSLEGVLHALLASPNFVYRIELAKAADPVSHIAPLGPYEVASRLSYLIWGSMPDEELLSAADAGHLGTVAEVRAQVARMVVTPRARSSFNHFVGQWLGIDRLELAEKDAKLFPTFTADVRALLRTERERFTDDLMDRGDGRLTTLLTSPQTFMNAALARFYGAKGPKTDAFEAVAQDPTQRSGLLTQAGLLAVHAKPNQSSPVARGKFVREKLFCFDIPAPPVGLAVVAPDPSPTLTTRERFAQHTTVPSCASCHKLMDPIGLGFEKYDAIGQLRLKENARDVDATGSLVGTDVDGDFDGATQLSGKLASSAQVQACAALQWFRYAAGRLERDEDLCAISAVRSAFSAVKGDLRGLAAAFADTDAFRFRRAAADERM